MKSFAVVFALVLSGAAFAGTNEISNVQMVRDGRNWIVSYTLAGEASIVTPALYVDGVRVPESRMTTLSGDVCRLVEPGERSFAWKARADWPDQKTDNLTVELTAWSRLQPPDYMVVDLLTASNITYYVSTNALPGGLANDDYRLSKVVLRRIPVTENGWERSYTVTRSYKALLTQDYWFSIYPVTQQQYAHMHRGGTVAQKWPSWFTNATDRAMRPVEKVGYVNFRCSVDVRGGYLSEDPMTNHVVAANLPLGLLRAWTGIDFDLPTLAQWEYACRAGTTGAYYDDNPGSGAAFALGRCKENGGWKTGYEGDPKDKADIRNWRSDEGGTAIVGQCRPNAWGLYDMLGNIWEWTLGWSPDSTTYQGSPLVDPHGGVRGSTAYDYVVGGNWYLAADSCSVAGGANSSLDSGNSRKGGFRLCVPVSGRW